MKLEHKILLLNAAVLVATTTIGGLLVLTYQMVPRKLDQSELIHQVSRDITGLAIALDDHQLRSLARSRREWQVVSQRLARHLDQLEERSRGRAHAVSLIRTAHREVDALFHILPASPTGPPTLAERVISDQISARLQDMIGWSDSLAARIKDQLAAAQRRASAIIIAFAMAVLAVAIGSQVFFRRAVLRPLQVLERGAELVGTGRFDLRIERRAEDEIGHLADVFNEMTHRLEELTRSREEFISAAIHEIKTPVAVIKAAAQLMHRIPPEEQAARYPDLLARIDRQCNRLTRLVTGVLEVLRLELQRVELRRRPTDMAALVSRVVEEMQEASSRHRLVITRNDPMEGHVDPDRIEQVLANLIDNAIRYSPAGGDIEISSRCEDGAMHGMVRDRGIGIPADRQERVFERFYRAHAGTPYDLLTSLGVGLYLSRELVNRHGGQLWFESEEGRGSTFYFRIPLRPAGQEGAA